MAHLWCIVSGPFALRAGLIRVIFQAIQLAAKRIDGIVGIVDGLAKRQL